jgi:hypothetical protein
MNIHTPERGETESWGAYKERRLQSKAAYEQSQKMPATSNPKNPKAYLKYSFPHKIIPIT